MDISHSYLSNSKMEQAKAFGARLYRVFFDPDDRGRDLPVEVISCGYGKELNSDYHWDNARHLANPIGHHEDFIFQWTVKGHGFFQDLSTDGSTPVPVGVGQFFVAEKNQPYRYYLGDSPEWCFYWATLKGTAVAQILGECRTLSTFGTTLPFPCRSFILFREMVESIRNALHWDRSVISAACYQFLAALLSDLTESGPADQVRREALKYVSSKIDRVSVGSLSAHFGYHPKYFQAYFKANTGVTPHRFILSVRLEHAKNLLNSTTMGVAEVAQACGFVDPFHFSKVFHAWVGEPPREYSRRFVKDERLTKSLPTNFG